jgi:hypothetical protein
MVDLLGRKDPLAALVNVVIKATKAIQVDHKAYKASAAIAASVGTKVNLVPVVHKVRRANMAAHKACREPLALKAKVVPLDPWVRKAIADHKELLVPVAHKEHREQQVEPVPLAHKAHEGIRDQQDHKALLAFRVIRVQAGNLD